MGRQGDDCNSAKTLNQAGKPLSATSSLDRNRREQVLFKTHHHPKEIDCAFTASGSASRSITKFYDLVLAPTGLKITQFIALKAIHDAREIAQHEFARKHLVAVETLSRVFGGLRRNGLISARTGEKHEQLYTLTSKGQATLDQALPYWERAQARLRAILGSDGWLSLISVCNSASAACGRAEQLLYVGRTAKTKPDPAEQQHMVFSTCSESGSHSEKHK
jgi:DNA-binding MarR family transcriptional regulator